MCRLVRRTLMSLPKLVRCSTSMMESTLFLFQDSFQHPKVNFPREAERCEKLEHTLRSPKDGNHHLSLPLQRYCSRPPRAQTPPTSECLLWTTEAAAFWASQNLSAATEDSWDNQARKLSFFSLLASITTSVHQWVLGFPP